MKPAKPFLLLLIFLQYLLFSCNNAGQGQVATSDTLQMADTVIPELENPDSALVDSTAAIKTGIKLKPTGNYNQLKKQIAEKRSVFYKNYQNADASAKAAIINEASDYLFQCLLNQVIPFWYGTPWNISGYSNVPQQGVVGCSYFVSNTLVACGFNLNRFRLAQTDPIAGSKSLTFNDSVVQYTDSGSVEVLGQTILKNHKDGLYVIGLDIHIGYLLVYQSNLYFIHSAYYYPVMVCIEYFEKSPGIQSSQNYYVTPITNNRKLIEKWLSNEFIFIQKPEFMQVDKAWWDKQ